MSRDLRPLFAPRSVAVVGASADPAKWGHWLARGALQGEGRRPVYLVNRRGGQVLGRAVFRSLDELPEPPELVAIAVPAAGFEQAVDDALRAGARALVAITAGLGEMGEEGRAREQAVVAKVRERGAVLLGPNCLGVFDAESELHLVSNPLPAGPIGLISQSGNLALEVALLAQELDLGLSRFVSVGNQADLGATELIAALAAHPGTQVIALYCEDFGDGRAFVDAAAQAGKPVVLLAAGTTPAGARAARSHTGALVSAEVAIEAACRAAGMVRVRTPGELVETALALLSARRPNGPRVAVVGDGGGHGVVACDLVLQAGLQLPPLSEELARRLRAFLPPTASTANPIDFAGGGEQDVRSFQRVAGSLLASGEVDSVLLTGYFGGYGEYDQGLAARELEVAGGLADEASAGERPLIVHTMYWRSPAASLLRRRGVPVYRTVESAVRALARLTEAASTPQALRRTLPLPPPRKLPEGFRGGYFEARALLAQAGIAFPEARRVESLEEALAAAAEIGYPVVLKAAGLLHKSDAGGVALGLADEGALAEAFLAMEGLGGEYAVERMVPRERGLELIVGARRDRRFGPILLVGLGGVYAEALGDVAAALAPVDEEQALALLSTLRGASLLAGARGRPPLAVAAAAGAASSLSRVAALYPQIEEIEVNPLLVTPDGALGLDARAVVAEGGGDREEVASASEACLDTAAAAGAPERREAR